MSEHKSKNGMAIMIGIGRGKEGIDKETTNEEEGEVMTGGNEIEVPVSLIEGKKAGETVDLRGITVDVTGTINYVKKKTANVSIDKISMAGGSATSTPEKPEAIPTLEEALAKSQKELKGLK